MRIILVLYKCVYCATLAIVAGVLLQGSSFESITTKTKALVMCGYVLVLFVTGAVTVMFWRLSRTAVWALVILLCGLFTWHGWFGPGGFFVQTEGHTFEPGAAAVESAKFNRQALISNVIMIAWFLSLPVFRQFAPKRISGDSKRHVRLGDS